MLWHVLVFPFRILLGFIVSRVGKNHDFFEKIEKIDLIDLIDDLIDEHIHANFRLFSYRIPFFVIKINPVHVSLYQSLQFLQKINENSCITIYKD